MLTNVVQLLNHDRPVFMTGIGDAPEMGDDGIVAVAEIAAREHCRAMYRHWLDDNHCGTADGALQVVAQMPVAGQPINTHVGGMRAEVQAVFKGFRTNRQGFEQMLEGYRHAALRHSALGPRLAAKAQSTGSSVETAPVGGRLGGCYLQHDKSRTVALSNHSRACC